MPKGSRTTLFVSSTCYDLSQVRADLWNFAESFSLEPVMSEYASFPVNPSTKTVENCLEAVRTRADIFLLVVGNRYGSLTGSGRSVTNLEFVEASARAIPRYVFVKKDILAVLPVWKANPQADFTSTVDNPKLFEFVSQLRDSGAVWVFPFDTAQDIVDTMKKQLSYLLSDCLELRAKMQTIDEAYLLLGPESLRLFVEKPKGWEYLVFAKLFQERVAKLEHKKLDLELKLGMGTSITLRNIAEANTWLSLKLSHARQPTENFTNALNNGIEKAVGAPGEPGNITRIAHVARRMADSYEELLDWTLEFNRVRTAPQLERLFSLASNFTSNAIREIEDYAATLFDRVRSAIESHKPGTSISFTLTLTAQDSGEFTAELERLGKLSAEELMALQPD